MTPRPPSLHQLVKQGDLPRLREILDSHFRTDCDINGFDRHGYTPLMYAVKTAAATVDLVRLLLEHGARIDLVSRSPAQEYPVLALALHGGDPEKVKAMIDAGADIRHQRSAGYDALLDAVHGRDILRDARLLQLLRLLIAEGVALSSVSTYQESGLRVLSRLGRFDAVQLLLDAGADADQLKWTPLIQAVALGSLADVEQLLVSGVPLEQVDWWSRTAWLVAIQTGDIAKTKLLRDHGANTAARGRCGTPALFYAIKNHDPAMLRWLLEIALDVEETDDFGVTALMTAAQSDNMEAVDTLLKSGADVTRERDGQTALSDASSREVAQLLLNAGADPRHLSQEARRSLLGFAPDPDVDLLASVAADEFQRARTRRFGTRNPETIDEPFWEGMIRAGVTAYEATQFFSGPSSFGRAPVWCAQRFGQSMTFLPDGRIVQIGGEHEDHYDPDFCIYNDVFVHEVDGTIRIFAYPESVFPPTDFHTATLIDGSIYVIGSLGYVDARRYGETPVYRLDTRTFRLEGVETSGPSPGWIYQHRATMTTSREILIDGGKIVTKIKGEEVHADNQKSFAFDTERQKWREVPSGTA